MQAEFPDPAPPARRRGRPRSDQARRAILRAARGLLHRDGLTAVTVEAVAAEAGVGKPTIYRSWPNAQALAMSALMDGGPLAAPTGEAPASAIGALRQQLRDIAATFASRIGRSVATMLAAAEADTELAKAFRHHFILARRDEGRALLLRALAVGDIRADVEPEAALDLIYAPIFYRLLLGRGALDAAYADAILDLALHGLGRVKGRRKPKPVSAAAPLKEPARRRAKSAR